METEAVKLTVADDKADELCVLATVLDTDGDTVPDFVTGPLAD